MNSIPNDRLEISSTQSQEAYDRAERDLQDLRNGFVCYDRLFLSIDAAKTAFTRLISGELLTMYGTEFLWRRSPAEPMSLFAHNPSVEHLRAKGIVEICRVRDLPESWVGTGMFRVFWPDNVQDGEQTSILFGLYLYSTDPGTFPLLIDTAPLCTFLAALYFEKENAALLEDLAYDRFDSIV